MRVAPMMVYGCDTVGTRLICSFSHNLVLVCLLKGTTRRHPRGVGRTRLGEVHY